MAGLPNELVEPFLRHIGYNGTHNLPESVLHMRPDCFLAIVVAGVWRLEHEDEFVACSRFILNDVISHSNSLVSCVIIQNNVRQLRLLKHFFADLRSQLLQKPDQIVLVRRRGQIEDWLRGLVPNSTK